MSQSNELSPLAELLTGADEQESVTIEPDFVAADLLSVANFCIRRAEKVEAFITEGCTCFVCIQRMERVAAFRAFARAIHEGMNHLPRKPEARGCVSRGKAL